MKAERRGTHMRRQKAYIALAEKLGQTRVKKTEDTMTDRHATPRPWKAEDRIVKGHDGSNVTGIVLSRMTEANTTILLESVNAYDTLKAQNAAMREALEECVFALTEMQPTETLGIIALGKAKAALAQGK